jgi:SAM-dependent methyltransferase
MITHKNDPNGGVLSLSETLSPRLAAIVQALPLRPGLRVLEIGCGPGAAARAVAERVGNGYVLGVDRSAKAIAQAVSGSAPLIAAGRLGFRLATIETFVLEPGEQPFDLAFAVRVGVLDGRHPRQEAAALLRIRDALRNGGRLFLDGGEPLRQISLRPL